MAKNNQKSPKTTKNCLLTASNRLLTDRYRLQYTLEPIITHIRTIQVCSNTQKLPTLPSKNSHPGISTLGPNPSYTCGRCHTPSLVAGNWSHIGSNTDWNRFGVGLDRFGADWSRSGADLYVFWILPPPPHCQIRTPRVHI